ncbi:G-D-S-L family lipolytic protein [Polaribacter undariae]|uniref:G-D-S-L family lipolytic protein n=1 Tax=Polaribacter sejongensis TaxID=985043 RepID=A0AAJ1QU20_9FLAO|nr:G-D-S-L family lipolytic protein [Polaribacter undariae]MDN3618248.1 G-D-S-L family lipolytic protein [Polaribacter undariae]UWD30764.1 G-D-S-L family lipolytic protein [Polaribacter undariae]
MKNYKYIGLFLLAFSFTSCDVNNELDEIVDPVKPLVTLNKNGLDFSTYISIGASFTAGYTDGALFKAGQENSFPNILAAKFGTTFKQPLMNDNIGGLVFNGTAVQPPRFYFDGAGPTRLSDLPTTPLTAKVSGPFNNFGVPGAKSFHLGVAGYGTLNPYFGRMESSSSATVIGDALAQAPTFFTLSEIGGNDVLGYALSGGSGVDQTGNYDPSTYGETDITDPNVFANVLNGMVTALTSNGAKGVVANVPYITDLANFVTVPYNPVPLDAATAQAVNAGYAPYNSGLQAAAAALAGTGLLTDDEVAKRTISFAAGQNAVVIIDEDLTDLGAINPAFAALPKYRQATAGDLLLLASSAIIGTTVNGNASLINGVSVPLADNWVLTPEEQAAIKTATDAYNATIETITSTNENVALVDFKGLLQEASEGIIFDKYRLNTSLVTGGLISLDGVHLTGRGYALMANEILVAIDAEFGSNFTLATDGLAKADDYPTNYSPTLK